MLQLEWSNGNTQNYAVLLTLEISGTVILKREKFKETTSTLLTVLSTVLSWVDTPSTPLPVNGSQPRGGSKEGRQLLAFHFSVSEKVGKEENTGFRGHLFLLSFLSNPTPKPTSMSCYFLKNKLGTRSPLATFRAFLGGSYPRDCQAPLSTLALVPSVCQPSRQREPAKPDIISQVVTPSCSKPSTLTSPRLGGNRRRNRSLFIL